MVIHRDKFVFGRNQLVLANDFTTDNVIIFPIDIDS